MKTYNRLKGAPKPHVIENLRELLQSAADRFESNPVYTYKVGDKWVDMSYREYFERVCDVGTALEALGIVGERFAIIGDTHPYWMVGFEAVINSGGIVVPLDRDLQLEEAVGFMNIADCTNVIYTGKFNKKFTAMTDKLPKIKHFIAIDDEGEDSSLAPGKVISMSALVKMGAEERAKGNNNFLTRPIDMEKLAAILFTSGTTGTSKGVMLNQRNFTAATNCSDQSMSFDSRQVYLSVLPVHHTYELTCAQHGIINLGSHIYINDNLRHFMRNINEAKPDTLVLVPLFCETFYKKIWEGIRKRGLEKKVRTVMAVSDALLKVGIDLRETFFKEIKKEFGGRLRNIVVGGAPLDPKIIKDFYSMGIDVFEGYGITECSPLVAVNRAGAVNFESAGQPCEGVQVKIDPIEGDTEGEILVKGDNVMMGYYNNPEATAAVFTEDGFFRTGDIGHIDRDNYIYITGRKKNVIILSNGKNIYPEELESHFKLNYIKELVVIGRPNHKGEPVLTLIAYPDPDWEENKGMSSDEILTRLKEDVNAVNRDLPPYKHINSVELRDTEFEKNASKKIKRFLIR